MAYVSCAAKIAASIQQDCNKPLVGGYTGRAVIMSATDFERAEVVRSATNPRKILSVVLPPDGSVMAYTVDNVFAAPFTGSTTAGNTDNGRNGYLKTLSVRVPMRGADTSMKVVEPLVKDPNGFVMILEKRDKVGDGSYEVICYQNALRGDIAGVTRDESANGGDWIVPLTTVEKWAEVTLVGSAETYESAHKEFEGLLDFEPMVMRMHTSIENQGFFELVGSGQILIDIIKNGAPARISLINPNYDESSVGNCCLELNNDADTDIVIWGAVTRLNAGDDMDTGLTSFTSDNTALTDLILGGNEELTSLDVSKSTALTRLHCGGTELTSIDVSKNIALISLRCNSTELTSVDVSKNIALTELDCSSCTELTSIDVSKNIALTELDCSDCTSFTSLDVSNNTSLIKLICIDCSNLMLLDIQNTAQLAELNFFIGVSVITNLTTLQVAGTSAHAYEHVESWLNGSAPNDGKIYVDENTPQSVITAAEAKDWEVVYVS